MKRKIFGISGSPRKNGNTDGMINYVLSNASEKGYDTRFYRLYDNNIKPCIACDICRSNGGTCVIKDDLQALLEIIKESDVIVMGTPVYWWGPSAGFKTFMDRWYGVEFYTSLRKKKIVVLLPFEDPGVKAAEYAVGMIRASLEYIGADIADIILSPATKAPGDYSAKNDVIDKLAHVIADV